MDILRDLFIAIAVTPTDPTGGSSSIDANNVVGRIFAPFSAPFGMTGGQNLSNYILMLFYVALYGGLIAALLYIVYGAIKWITSGGDIKAIAAARNTITHAVLGVILLSLGLVMAQVIGQFVSPALDDTNSKAIYICGNGIPGEYNRCINEGRTPEECKGSATCHQVYSRVPNEKWSGVKQDYSNQYCTDPGTCDALCIANNSIQEYKYCRPL